MKAWITTKKGALIPYDTQGKKADGMVWAVVLGIAVVYAAICVIYLAAF